MKLSNTKLLILCLSTALTINTCSGEKNVGRILKGGKGEGGGAKGGGGGGGAGSVGKASKGKQKSKGGKLAKSKSQKGSNSPTISLAPTMLPLCKSKGKSKSTSVPLGKSKGKSSVNSESAVIPNWCPFDPELQNEPEATLEPVYSSKKSKKKSKKSSTVEDENPFSFLDGIQSFPAGTKVIILSKFDPTKCLQPTSVEAGAELIIDECRYDDDSIFTIDRYARLHTSKWGLCAVANADRTDVTVESCFDCGAVLNYDPETAVISLYENPSNVLSYTDTGTEVFLVEEIIEPTCRTIQPDVRRLADVVQTWIYVPIVELELPTDSPAPSSSMPPTRTKMPSTPLPTTSFPTEAPTSTPTIAPTPEPLKITDKNIASAAELFMDKDPGAKLYGDITDWDTSAVEVYYAVFDKSSVPLARKFNEDISNWDTSLGEYFNEMFRGAESFDQDIGAWDMSTAVYAFGMFQGALIFNQDISLWEVGEMQNFANMFLNAQGFNQDLSLWDFGSAKNVEKMFWDSGLNIDQCFDLSGTGDQLACEIFKGSVGGDYLFCDSGMC
eukprot:CAMPEP_0194270352 /NCGR_PEP_ID=MMETSP0169-20130528/4341_1 /TAXON_ID=218684 /ORGANISM="Corethron pennatum, Strain L29A3" /LENGTH=554 /DNA_ID=CAMNT_0039012363 /DNA_START=127 /DNA_END=1791 /DNA_ORIENTATION=+